MEPITSNAIGRWRRPGFLLEPLGWVQDRLANAFEAEPTLVELLFELDQSRMHLTALALAHMTGEVTPDLAVMLLQESKKTILNLSVGHRPVGIDRVLSHLPPKVLTAESYRKLTDLLLVPATAKFLHHRTSITEQIITGLHTLPVALRSVAIMSMFSPFCRMVLFVDGLRFLASRTGLPFELLANQIGALDQPDQVAAKITQLVEGLPLPDTFPPVEIGGFRRLDAVAESLNTRLAPVKDTPRIAASEVELRGVVARHADPMGFLNGCCVDGDVEVIQAVLNGSPRASNITKAQQADIRALASELLFPREWATLQAAKQIHQSVLRSIGLFTDRFGALLPVVKVTPATAAQAALKSGGVK